MPSIGGTQVFTRANAGACTIQGLNHPPGLGQAANWFSNLIWGAWHTTAVSAGGVDQDVQQFFVQRADKGICAGITLAWVINVLTEGARAEATGAEAAGATTVDGFPDAFRDMLRFQGAYFQKLREDTRPVNYEAFFASVDQTVRSGVRVIEAFATRSFTPAHLPNTGAWACVTSVHGQGGGHAIGGALIGGTYLIMDPNFGLYRYSTAERFTDDLWDLYSAYSVALNDQRRREFTFFA